MIEQSIRIGTQSITLDGEYKSTWPNPWAFYHVKNIGDADALVSTVSVLEDLTAPTSDIPDEVISIPVGASLSVPGRHSAVLLTSGKVQVVANNNPCCPFKVAQVANETQPGHIYIFEGKYACEGWSYSLDPSSTFINSMYCNLYANKKLTISGKYPEGYKNIAFLLEANSSIGDEILMEIFDAETGSTLTSRTISMSTIKGQNLSGTTVLLNTNDRTAIYGKNVNIVVTGTTALKLSRIYLSITG